MTPTTTALVQEIGAKCIGMQCSLLSFGFGFIFGAVIGFILAKVTNKEKTKGWERSVISMVVLTVWVASFIADTLLEGYHTPTALHTIMGIVAGYFFESNVVEALKGRKTV